MDAAMVKPRISILLLAGIIVVAGCSRKQTGSEPLFSLDKQTGINFENKVVDSKSDNSFAFRNYYNGGGVAIGDINNDGLADVIELDMNPEDNYRKKMMMGSNNYSLYQNADYFGYQYQYVRNTLHLNQGP